MTLRIDWNGGLKRHHGTDVELMKAEEFPYICHTGLVPASKLDIMYGLDAQTCSWMREKRQACNEGRRPLQDVKSSSWARKNKRFHEP